MQKLILLSLTCTICTLLFGMDPVKRRASQELCGPLLKKEHITDQWQPESWRVLPKEMYALIAGFMTHERTAHGAWTQMRTFLTQCKKGCAVLADRRCNEYLINRLIAAYTKKVSNTLEFTSAGRPARWVTDHYKFDDYDAGCVETSNNSIDAGKYTFNRCTYFDLFHAGALLLNTKGSLECIKCGFECFELENRKEKITFSRDDVLQFIPTLYDCIPPIACNYEPLRVIDKCISNALRLSASLPFLRFYFYVTPETFFVKDEHLFPDMSQYSKPFLNALTMQSGTSCFDSDFAFEACNNGDVYLLQFLLEKGIIPLDWKKKTFNGSGFLGDTLLHLLVRQLKHVGPRFDDRSKFIQCIHLLLASGIDINVKNTARQTAAQVARCKPTKQKMIKFFPEAQKKLMESRPLSETMVKNDNFALIQKCVLEGQSVNWQDSEGNTLLHFVLKHNPTSACSLAQFLLAHGANAHQRNNEGKSAFHLAWEDAKVKNNIRKKLTAAHIICCSRMQALFETAKDLRIQGCQAQPL